MARKKKPRAKQAKAQSPEDAARAAARHLEQERYRDAAAEYKQLLKDDRRPEWVEGLARAYAGRAAHLASRGMIKEAIALWQTRAETCDTPLADPRYLQWLIAADRTPEIARLYSQDATALAGADGVAALQTRLAAAALADGGELIEQLPADDPVVRDFAAADAALTAYADGDDETLQTALARIAFRSPYRDFRQLLKALTRYEQDPAAAAELCARMPADTPFAGILKALDTAGQIGSATPVEATTLTDLDNGIQNLLAALAGWSSAQQQIIAPLARLGATPTQRELFDFVPAHRKLLGPDYARDAAFLLAGNDHSMHRRLIKLYRGLPDAAVARLRALGLEDTNMLLEAIDAWQRMLDALDSEPAQDAEASLRCALIHRRIADLIQPRSVSLPLDSGAIHHLTASLEYDAADHETTLRLLDHYLHVGGLKTARGWVDQALAQFPDDPECLFKAAEVATAGKAYKKAARFAERILSIDPINADARGLLVDAHLGHARKQIQADKPDAARRETDNAAGFARTAVDRARVALLDGLTTFAHDGAKAAAPALVAGVERADDALVGRFFLLLEAGRAGQKPASVSRAADLPAAKTLGELRHVLALVDALGALRTGQQHQPSAEAALTKLAPALNQAANAKLDRGRAEQICETLLRYRQYKPLKRYAQAALKRWASEPLFVFYRIMGHMQGNRVLPWDKESRQLDAAFARARDAGDERAAERIRATLEEMLPLLPDADDFAPLEDDMAPDPSSIPTLIDGELSPMLRDILEQFLEPADMRRLDAAIQRGEPIPTDILSKIQTLIAADEQEPAPRRRDSGQKNRRSGQDNEGQADLFGDDS